MTGESLDAISAAAEPWWGKPVIAGCFLVVGAFIAFIASVMTKKRELSRFDQARWDDDILEICAGVRELVFRFQSTFGSSVLEEDADTRKAMFAPFEPEFVAANEKRWKLEFIASPALASAVGEVIRSARQSAQDSERERRMNADLKLSEACDELTKLARKQLRSRH